MLRRGLVLILIVSMLAMTACTDAKPQSLEEFYLEAGIQAADKITIQDGSTGYSKTLVDKEEMDGFLASIDDIMFIPKADQEKREGWRYSVSLFDGEEAFNFTLNEIEGTYYYTEPDIFPIVDRYYKELELSEQ